MMLIHRTLILSLALPHCIFASIVNRTFSNTGKLMLSGTPISQTTVGNVLQCSFKCDRHGSCVGFNTQDLTKDSVTCSVFTSIDGFAESDTVKGWIDGCKVDMCEVKDVTCLSSINEENGVCSCPENYVIKNAACKVWCKSPFVLVNAQCFFFNTATQYWGGARDQCRTYEDSDLAIIDDVKGLASYMAGHVHVTWYHVGANNRVDSSKHTWVNGTDVSLTPGVWGTSEPSLADADQCVHIHPTHEGGVFADHICNNPLASICQTV